MNTSEYVRNMLNMILLLWTECVCETSENGQREWGHQMFMVAFSDG